MTPFLANLISIIAPTLVGLSTEHIRRILGFAFALAKQVETSGIAVLFMQETIPELSIDMKASLLELKTYIEEELSAMLVDAEMLPATIINLLKQNLLGLFSKFI